ncbi:hypothetical protein ABLE92_12210 [Gordonia sp. VNQ95]|uniref:hypothetical protein n=1 Tax=Gordonia sp. VNQ95 TaxID=3156619 RepID=UPI0032B6166B
MKMDRILFGDNQFFGVNHMSEEKARAQAMKFQDLDEIMTVLRSAYDNGITTFMCTTHARIGDVIERMKQEPDAWSKQTFYPCMPYAHKYANAMTEDGMLGAIKKFLPDSGLFDAALRGTRSLATKDIEGITTLLIDAEMKMFDGFPTPVIFLQNVVVDLLLGLGFKDAFAIFADHVKSKYRAEPGFITMNLPLCLETLDTVGIENPIVCSNINKIGFRMSGGLDAYEQAIATHEFRAIAMSVFASGALSPSEALDWLKLQGIDSFVFGASSGHNIRSTREIATSVWAS